MSPSASRIGNEATGPCAVRISVGRVVDEPQVAVLVGAEQVAGGEPGVVGLEQAAKGALGGRDDAAQAGQEHPDLAGPALHREAVGSLAQPALADVVGGERAPRRCPGSGRPLQPGFSPLRLTRIASPSVEA